MTTEAEIKQAVRVVTTYFPPQVNGYAKAKLIMIDKFDRNSGDVYLFNKKRDINMNPILISSDPIEVGDNVYDIFRECIFKATNTDEGCIYDGDLCVSSMMCKKIIAMPENFPTDLLQCIFDKQLKHGDDVLLECETKYKDLTGRIYNLESDMLLYDKDGFFKSRSWNQVKLDTKNHISIHPLGNIENYIKLP